MDEDDLEEEGMVEGGFFPFLAVLSCTIAVMILILIGGAASMAMKDPEHQEHMDLARKENTLALSKVSSLRAELDEKEDALKLAKQRLANSLQQAEALAEEASPQEIRLRDLTTQNERLTLDIKDLTSQVTERRELETKLTLTRRIEEIQASRGKLKQERETERSALNQVQQQVRDTKRSLAGFDEQRRRLKKLAAAPEVRFNVPAFTNFSGKKPVFIEVQKDAVVVHTGLPMIPAPAGTRIPVQARGVNRELERIARDIARPEGGRFAVLLVRPDAVHAFGQVQGALQNMRAPHCFEPVDAAWRLTFAAD